MHAVQVEYGEVESRKRRARRFASVGTAGPALDRPADGRSAGPPSTVGRFRGGRAAFPNGRRWGERGFEAIPLDCDGIRGPGSHIRGRKLTSAQPAKPREARVTISSSSGSSVIGMESPEDGFTVGVGEEKSPTECGAELSRVRCRRIVAARANCPSK